nr:D111/G-patch domain-containing protein [Ipomoea batatas]
MQMLMRNFLDVENLDAELPEHLVRLRRSQLVPKQNDAVLFDKRFHGGDERAHRLLQVNHVGGNNNVERFPQSPNLLLIVPIQLSRFQGLVQNLLVSLQNVVEAQQEQAHGGDSAAGSELHPSLVLEVEELGVGVFGGGARLRVPTLGEFDGDESITGESVNFISTTSGDSVIWPSAPEWLRSL